MGACTAGSTSTGVSNDSIQLSNNGWVKPSWQTGVSGIPSDGVRDIPDVSFFASDGFLSSSAYLICVSEASADPQCNYSTNSEPYAQEVGGTSVATPAMAGVMALINQRTGAAQGNPNAELYKLAASQNYSACSAESVKANSSACYFNDIDTGTIAMPCDYSAYTNTPSPNCTIAHSWDYVGIATGYSAGVGYDLATGLGSLNISNVVNAWPVASVGISAATVTVNPAQQSLNSVNALPVTVTLASTTSGGAIPTGTVTLTASGSSYSQSVTSSTGSYSFTIPANSLPGTPAGKQDTLTATYGGDAVFAENTGTASVTVTASTFALAATTPATIAPGATAASTVTVSTTSGYAGIVTLTCNFTSTTAASGGDGATCTLTNPTLSSATLSSSTTSGMVGFTVSTTAPVKAALVYPKVRENGGGWIGAGGGAVLAFLLFLGVPTRRRSWRAMLGSLVVMVALGSLAGCGGGSGSSGGGGSSDPGTLAGTYTFTVQATGNPAVNPAVSTTFTVTVN